LRAAPQTTRLALQMSNYALLCCMIFASAPERFDQLFRHAEGQAGFFTAEQAKEAGYSRQLLNHHLHARRMERWYRGVYRLVHFPHQNAREDLVMYWLWSSKKGVFSHETALSIHQLSDALPARVHMTLQTSEAQRRRRAPPALMLSYGDVQANEQQVVEGVPVTSPARTVNDCAQASVSPELVHQAVKEGLARKLFRAADIRPALTYLQPYAS
jgi:predicted transcriptional regulator of viral defense system